MNPTHDISLVNSLIEVKKIEYKSIKWKRYSFCAKAEGGSNHIIGMGYCRGFMQRSGHNIVRNIGYKYKM